MRQIEKDVFLNALRNGVTVKQAAETAGVSRATVYRHRHSDPELDAAWEDAYDEGADILEAEAHRRAVDGVEDFKMAGDEMIPLRRYSDTLLIFLLKARRPAKFRDNHSLQVTGSAGGPVSFVVESAFPEIVATEYVEEDDGDTDPAALPRQSETS